MDHSRRQLLKQTPVAVAALSAAHRAPHQSPPTAPSPSPVPAPAHSSDPTFTQTAMRAIDAGARGGDARISLTSGSRGTTRSDADHLVSAGGNLDTTPSVRMPDRSAHSLAEAAPMCAG